MSNRSIFSRRSFILMSLSMSVAACKSGAALLELSGATMGTSYSVVGLDQDRSIDNAALRQAIENSLQRVNAQLSNWDPTSEVSRFNAMRSTEPMAVSDALAKVVGAAQEVSRASDGQFDITLAPVIEAWGFGAHRTHGGQPDMSALDAARAAAGQTDSLRLTGPYLQKSRADTQIFLSSIGKGFGVDQVAETLSSFGLTDFMVEIGGDLYVSGRNPDGQPWQIGIESPDGLAAQAFQIASISNLGMATSGDYRNYFDTDGTRYSHIIDAQTGRPITHRTASVTVLAENAMLADAWATALLVLGSERGLELANSRDLAVLFIDHAQDAGDKALIAASSRRFAALQG